MVCFFFFLTTRCPLSIYFENQFSFYVLSIYILQGIRLKKYRGMGSIEAMAKGSEKRYFASGSSIKVAQGVSGSVVDKGSLRLYLPYLINGLKQGLQDIGCTSLNDLNDLNTEGLIKFELRSSAAQREGGIHSVQNVNK